MGASQNTADERRFIWSLGRQSDVGRDTPRAELLRGYLVGCEKRDRWDGIDRDAVTALARAELDREEHGASRHGADQAAGFATSALS